MKNCVPETWAETGKSCCCGIKCACHASAARKQEIDSATAHCHRHHRQVRRENFQECGPSCPEAASTRCTSRASDRCHNPPAPWTTFEKTFESAHTTVCEWKMPSWTPSVIAVSPRRVLFHARPCIPRAARYCVVWAISCHWTGSHGFGRAAPCFSMNQRSRVRIETCAGARWASGTGHDQESEICVAIPQGLAEKCARRGWKTTADHPCPWHLWRFHLMTGMVFTKQDSEISNWWWSILPQTKNVVAARNWFCFFFGSSLKHSTNKMYDLTQKIKKTKHKPNNINIEARMQSGKKVNMLPEILKMNMKKIFNTSMEILIQPKIPLKLILFFPTTRLAEARVVTLLTADKTKHSKRIKIWPWTYMKKTNLNLAKYPRRDYYYERSPDRARMTSWKLSKILVWDPELASPWCQKSSPQAQQSSKPLMSTRCPQRGHWFTSPLGPRVKDWNFMQMSHSACGFVQRDMWSHVKHLKRHSNVLSRNRCRFNNLRSKRKRDSLISAVIGELRLFGRFVWWRVYVAIGSVTRGRHALTGLIESLSRMLCAPALFVACGDSMPVSSLQSAPAWSEGPPHPPKIDNVSSIPSRRACLSPKSDNKCEFRSIWTNAHLFWVKKVHFQINSFVMFQNRMNCRSYDWKFNFKHWTLLKYKL